MNSFKLFKEGVIGALAIVGAIVLVYALYDSFIANPHKTYLTHNKLAPFEMDTSTMVGIDCTGGQWTNLKSDIVFHDDIFNRRPGDYLVYADSLNYVERRCDTAIVRIKSPRLVTSGHKIQYQAQSDTIFIPYLRIVIRGEQIDWRNDGK